MTESESAIAEPVVVGDLDPDPDTLIGDLTDPDIDLTYTSEPDEDGDDD